MLKVVFFLRNRVKFKAIYPGKINGVFLQASENEREAVIAIFNISLVIISPGAASHL